MRIFVAGATGLLGRRVVPLLVAKGHAVVGLARRDENEPALKALGAEPRRADLFDAASVAKAAEGCEVVMHLATSIPPRLVSKTSEWAMNDRLRTEGTKNLLAAAKGAALYVQQSIGLVHGSQRGLVREDAPYAAKPHRLVRSAIEMEQLVKRSGLKAAILRCAIFYGADDPRTKDIVDRVRRRRLPFIGDGDNFTSHVHLDDAAAAFAAVVEKGAPGTWNVVDDRPVTSKEFLRSLSNELHVKDPWDLPEWFAWLVMGPSRTALATMSLALDNTRAKEELGWKPSYPTFREGWKAVVKSLG
jgi:nucleoside-diphosphate-sugar epimerase